jgi:hypothetical protein
MYDFDDTDLLFHELLLEGYYPLTIELPPGCW